MKSARKMSRSASRESTKCRPSNISRMPATQPSRVEPVIRRTSRHSTSTIRAPATAEAIRQPNGSIPNAFSPSAINHLPTSGWTASDGSPVHTPCVCPARMSALMSVFGLPSTSVR